MNLYNLTATLTLDDSDYKKGIKDSEKGAKDFSKESHKSGMISAKSFMKVAAAVAVAAGAVFKLVKSTIDLGGDIDDNSQKLNMSAESYQKWSYLLKMAGTDISTMQTGMRTFTGILDNATNGQADALLTLEELGLAYKDFADLSVEDSFKLVIEQLQKMEKGTRKTQLAQKLFGRAGQELLPLLNMETGSVDKLFKKYEQLGIIMSDDMVQSSASLGDSIDLLTFQFKALLRDVGAALYPLIESVINFINEFQQSELAKNIIENFNELIERLQFLQPLIDAIGEVLSFSFESISLNIDNLLIILNAVIAFITGDFTGAWENMKEVVSGHLDFMNDKFGWIFDGIKKGFKAFVNFFIDGINLILKGINKIGFNIPDWVPKIGGQKWGFNIPLIPRLQRGMDYIPRDMYPAYLDAGERVLTKVENKQYNAVGGAEGIAALVNGIVGANQMGGNSGPVNVNLQVKIGDKEIKDFIYKTVDDKMKAQGFKSLKKVGAYND